MHAFGSPVFIALHSTIIKCTIARLHGMKTLRAVLYFDYTELLGWARGLEHLSRFIDHGGSMDKFIGIVQYCHHTVLLHGHLALH